MAKKKHSLCIKKDKSRDKNSFSLEKNEESKEKFKHFYHLAARYASYKFIIKGIRDLSFIIIYQRIYKRKFEFLVPICSEAFLTSIK